MSTEIIVPEIDGVIPVGFSDRETFFLNANGEILPVLEKAKEHYLSIVINTDDDKGRKEAKKLAAEVNKVKAAIDGAGKGIVDVYRERPNQINKTRNEIKTVFETIYNTILEPVKKYEDEQKRIKAEEEAKKAEEQRKKDEQLAALLAEKEQREREEQIKEEAANKAAIAAENKAKAAELEAQKARDELAKAQREQAEKEAKEKAEADRIAAEELRRQQDVEHKKLINRSALDAFLNFGIDEKTAKEVITLIATNKIPNISINY